MYDKPPILQMWRNKHTGKGWYYYNFTFILGEEYVLHWPHYDKDGYSTWIKQVVQFIKVTGKGFNLLDVETNKCVVYGRHLYDSRYYGSYNIVPRDQQVFHVKVPERIPFPIPINSEYVSDRKPC